MRGAVWLAFDAVFLALLLVVVGVPLAGIAWLVRGIGLAPEWSWGLMPVWGVLFLLGMCAVAGAVQLIVPRLVPGTYAFPGHPQSLAWLARFALQRILNLPLWSNLLYSFALLRWCALRSQGARVPLDLQTSTDASVSDPSLVTIGPGAMLAAGTFVAGHFVENGQLMLAEVVIGAGVQLMGEVTLAPGVRVGESTVIGPGSKLLPHVEVGQDVFVGLGCLIQQGAQIGANAVIGHQSTLEADVVVGEGAVVATGARVPRGTTIGTGEHYPPRQKAAVP